MSLNDFIILGSAGEGSFASVFKVRRKSDNMIYAMKKVNVSKMARKEIHDTLNEIRFLASFRHPYIVGFYECFQVKKEDLICIVLEYCPNGDLAQKVDLHKKKRSFFPESELWHYLAQVLEALKILHERGIVHRDVKTANCFVGEGATIKLGDLNVSKRIKDGMLLQTQTGTPYYMSPEIWQNESYDCSSDMWALGILLYELAALRKPFTASSFPELKKKILRGVYPPIKPRYSRDLIRVVSMLLRVNPKERPQAWELRNSSLVQRNLVKPLVSIEAEDAVELLDTINVPPNWDLLDGHLPKPCYPDQRPNSPDKWPAMDRCRSLSPDVSQHHPKPLLKKTQSYSPRRRHQSDNLLAFVRNGAQNDGSQPLTRAMNAETHADGSPRLLRPKNYYLGTEESWTKERSLGHQRQRKNAKPRCVSDSSHTEEQVFPLSSFHNPTGLKVQIDCNGDAFPSPNERSPHYIQRKPDRPSFLRGHSDNDVQIMRSRAATDAYVFREGWDNDSFGDHCSPPLKCSEQDTHLISAKGSVAHTVEQAKKTVRSLSGEDFGTGTGSRQGLRRFHSDPRSLKGGLDHDKEVLRKYQIQNGNDGLLEASIPIYVSNSVLELGPVDLSPRPNPPVILRKQSPSPRIYESQSSRT